MILVKKRGYFRPILKGSQHGARPYVNIGKNRGLEGKSLKNRVKIEKIGYFN